VTESIADASEMRCAYLLGAGKAYAAKISSYKSIFIGFAIATILTAIVFAVGGRLPGWLTTDPTLQQILSQLIPIFGVSNFFLTTGKNKCNFKDYNLFALKHFVYQPESSTSQNFVCDVLLCLRQARWHGRWLVPKDDTSLPQL